MNNDLPIVRRCVCGHVLDWHWRVGQTGGVVLDPVNGPRCADWTCECKKPEHDGNEPEQLRSVHTWPPFGERAR